ncbi:MAG: PEP-utilizing enzyme [Acidimicrobiia bacterium]
MIVDLDDDRSLDPGRVGAKAAWLARGRRVGLPVLPGFVVEGRASINHMRLGAETLGQRGSGGARLTITGEPLSFSDELTTRASRLGPMLVARSSTSLEASGEWSGAFTSYLDLGLDDLTRGVVGCWASAFTVATLERLERAAIEPGSVAISVIVQPALHPTAGGTARVEADGAITIIGTKGSPAPLLQGWVTGHQARVSSSSERSGHWEDGWLGDELIEMLGAPTLIAIAGNMRLAGELLGATQCEWAVVDGEVWLLQLGAPPQRGPASVEGIEGQLDDPHLIRLARTVVQAPGPLGEAWVLPWALGGLPDPVPTDFGSPTEAVREVTELCAQLGGEVWALPPESAIEAARKCIRALRGPDPASAIEQVRRLRPPNGKVGGRLLSLVSMVRSTMVELGAAADVESAWYLTKGDVDSVLGGSTRAMATRVGIGKWEPFVAAVVLSNGHHQRGTPASSGVGAGRRCQIDDLHLTSSFRARQVATAAQPVPGLAPLLWDAAGLVTASGSPAAHLFDSARALGVPAVCGVDLPRDRLEIVAVDGYAGVVSSLPLRGGDDE